MRIYVAHSYGRRHGLTDLECEINVLRSIKAARVLIDMGHNPFIPNLFHYVHNGWADSPPEDKYFEMVSEWIQFCDALLVADVPKWKSSGVLREAKIAEKLGIPVYYSIGDIAEDTDGK